MNYKRLLIISVIFLSLIGVIMITSSSIIWADFKFNDPYKYLKTQSLFLIIAIILMIFISKLDYRIYYKYANKIFLIVTVFLILVLIPGVGTIRNGSRSWFGIGGLGIQPSEFMKLAMIIFISKYLVNNNKELKNIKRGVLPILFIILIIFGIIMLQPDFGTGIVITIISISLLFLGGVNLNFFIKIGIVGIIGIICLIIIAPYRLKRIISFINPWEDPLGSGFQIIMSLYSIGPGGLFGYGLGNSRQKHFYLPEPQTDFIFSIIIEELGFFGAILIILLFMIIIFSGFMISKNCDNLFSKYVSFGITFWIAFQSCLNLSVVVGLLPVTGITLPFLSYGGSSLLILYIGIGILLNIANNTL